MIYPYRVDRMTVENHTFWTAKSLSLKGCVGQGDTMPEAVAELEANEAEWLETAREVNIPVPAVVS